MNLQKSWYPDVQVGDEVIFAGSPDALAIQWRLGKVHALKNNACDIVIFAGPGVVEYRHDCFHIDDPRCTNGKEWAAPDRGVFRLSPMTLQLRELFASRLPELERAVQRLENEPNRNAPRRGRPPKSSYVVTNG